MPWHVFQKTDDGNLELPTHPADALLYRRPNPEVSAAVWRELMLRDVLTWGNAYCEIERDSQDRPLALWPIRPDRVQVRRLSGPGLTYVVSNTKGDPTTLPQRNVFHVRGLGDDLAGWSVITYAANTIGLGLAQEETMSSLMRNNSRPPGLLTPTGPLPAEGAEQIRAEWQAAYGGSGNQGKTALLSHGMTYTPLGMPNEDAQLIENRRFSVLDICRFFGVPPHKVYDLERATFSNIEHQAIEFLQHTIQPWITKLEQEANRKLISQRVQGQVYTKINFNSLLRSDIESRGKYYQLLFDRGVYSVNDILTLEERNPIGPDGDKRFVPMNFVTLEKAGEEPEPPEPPERTLGEIMEDEPQEDEEAILDVYRPILRDALERITARECNAIRSGNIDKVERFFDNGHQSYVIAQLSPHVAALNRIAGQTLPVFRWASDYVQVRRQEVAAHLQTGGNVDQLAADLESRIDLLTNALLGITEDVQAAN
jgi:HK97 family phage portal protein